MSDDWETKFREVFDAGVGRSKTGCDDPDAMFEPDEVSFLVSIGCSAQEMFDFCDDYVGWDDVIYENVVELQGVRRDHFKNGLNSQPAILRMEMHEFPPKDAEVEGIAWLPRLIVKARAKLAGQLPADLMYG
jgi:hypothetical protein|tara:strand:- start:3805 stop:4200 length:396 start_codon:yes stop_codon:yes gene_type:complete